MKEQNEKQAIEEMAKYICQSDYCNTECHSRCRHGENSYCWDVEILAEKLYNAGYRKQSEVIDEFAKRLKEKMDDLSRMEYNDEPYFLVSKAFIDKIAEEMKGGEE